MNGKIIIVGAGNMGKSLMKGLISSGHSDLSLSIYDQHVEKLEAFNTEPSVNVISDPKSLNLTDAVVVLCIKPHDLEEFGKAFADTLSQKSVIISILAGIKINKLKQVLGFNGPVIRTMPNIAALYGCAATAMCQNGQCSDNDRDVAEKIFKSVGEAYWTKESLMDTVTGLSGSGPAYIYMVIEALTEGGVKMGLPRELSASLSVQTVLGAATMVKESGVHPAILKDQVSTPGGTTISALHALEGHGLRSMFVDAVCIATERSAFLGREE